jgi:RNA polymerase sigma-70 factor (ECF subfamily)
MSENRKNSAQVGRKDWASTYTNSYPRAAKLARRRSPIEEPDDVEDRIQDAFVRLLERRPDAEALEKPESYVLKTVQNVCFDRCKRRSRLRAENTVYLDAQNADKDERSMMELPDPRRGPEMDAEIKIDNERLLRILAEHCRDLTRRERDLLVLHLQGFTNEEIASAWGEDVKVIRADMNAVLAKIRYRLQHRERGASRS